MLRYIAFYFLEQYFNFYFLFQFDDLDHGLHRTHSAKVDTSLLIYFFGQKGEGQLGFDDFGRFMDNLQTEVIIHILIKNGKG